MARSREDRFGRARELATAIRDWQRESAVDREVRGLLAKAEAAKATVEKAAAGKGKVSVVQLDLASLDSVRKAAESLPVEQIDAPFHHLDLQLLHGVEIGVDGAGRRPQRLHRPRLPRTRPRRRQSRQDRYDRLHPRFRLHPRRRPSCRGRAM